MKTFTLLTIFVILRLNNQMFSQVNNKWELRPDNPLQERIIPHSIQDEKDGHPLKSDIFKNKESRTLVNKILLDYGFLLTEELWQQWDGSNWVNFWKYTYTYDWNNNMIEDLWQGGSNWVNFRKVTYTYDVNKNMIEDLYQRWDGSYWVTRSKVTYTYDVNKNMIEDLYQEWDGSNWVNYHKITNTYIITEIEHDLDYILYQNYPNPFNPSTTISYSVPEIEFVMLKVYDVLGNEIASLVNEEKPAGNYEVEFSVIALPSGVYFYRIQAGDFVETKKMILLR